MLVASGSWAPLSDDRAEAQTSPGGNDATFLWAEQFGTSAADGARSVAVSPDDGSALAVGYTNGALDPTGSSDPLQASPNTNAGGQDAFVRKHSRDGKWGWTRQFGSALSDDALDVAADRQGNVFVSGSGDPVGRGTSGGYIRKYSPNGATSNNSSGEVWTKQFSRGRIQTFSVDPEGNVYVALNINGDVYVYKYGPTGAFDASEPTGAFCNLTDFAFGSAVRGPADPSVYITGLTSGAEIDNPNNCSISDGTNELFLVKFDGNLNKLWDEQFGSRTGSGNAIGVTVDSAGDAYVAGYTNGTVSDPDPLGVESNVGGTDAFLVKYRGTDGAGLWAEQFGTAGQDNAWDVTIDPRDNLYVSGSTGGSFDPENKPSAGGTDAFVAKYGKDGTEKVVRQFGTPGSDSARSVAYDELTKGVVAGGFTDGALSGEQNAGGFDAFLVKMRAENLDGGPVPDPTAKKTPLIFVPSIGGTRLNYEQDPSDGVDQDTEKWPGTAGYLVSEEDAALRDLKLADENVAGRVTGQDPYTDEAKYRTEVGDIIRREATEDVYASTVEGLVAAGYVETEGPDQTLFPFPFDWRKGAESARGRNGETLLEYIEQVRRKTGSSKVDILAHSQGGLVTYSALRDPANVGKVRKVLTLGTPFLGSPKALALLQYRAGCFPAPSPRLFATQEELEQAMLDNTETCYVNPATLQEVVENFPGIYELLPSRQSQALEGSPLVVNADEDGDGAYDGEKPYDYWTGRNAFEQFGSHPDSVSEERNATLMERADGFHQQHDDVSLSRPADSSVEITRVIGDSLATPNYIKKELAGPLCVTSSPCGPSYKIEYTKKDRVEGGDGTVPLHSADLYDPSKGIDLRGGYPSFYAHNVEHGALARDESVLNFAVRYFEGTPEVPLGEQASSGVADFVSLRAAQAETAQAADPGALSRLAEESGLSGTPEAFSGIELATSGPVSGFVKGDGGEVLGDTPATPGPVIENTVPGGDYNAIGNNRSFFVNDADGFYEGKLRVSGNGDVKLNVRTYAEGRLVGQATFRVDEPAGTDLDLDLAAGGDLGASELVVDRGADDTVDRRLAPDSVVNGPAASDNAPPNTIAATRAVVPDSPGGQPNGGQRQPRPTEATVTLEAEDGPGGSGVEATYYALEDDAEPRIYEGPFKAPLGTTVRFSSTDKAGNAEPTGQVLVDDAPSSRATAEDVSAGGSLWRYLDPQGDADWYSFRADGASSYRAQLVGLPADYDLEIYGEDGRKVAASENRGKRSEEVRDKLPAGRYYLKVAGFENAWDKDLPYRLKVDKLGLG